MYVIDKDTEIVDAIDINSGDTVRLPEGPWGPERIGRLTIVGIPWESYESIDFLFEGEGEEWIRNIPRDQAILRRIRPPAQPWVAPKLPEPSEDFTEEERKAIKSLERLSKKWPKSLTLFSWSGTLVVFRTDDVRNQVGETGEAGYSLNDVPSVSIYGIPNDGGDPE